MPLPTPSGSPRAAVTHMRRVVFDLRTEGTGPLRDAAAVGTGVFIGCSPFYGLHFALCWLAGRVLRLNRLKMYVAANISNPVMAPVLILAELQAGAWLRRGTLHSLTLDAARTIDPWSFGADVLFGSLVVGGALGAAAALGTCLVTRGDEGADVFAGLVRRASERYVTTGITAWEFARGKLRRDPLYKTVLMGGVLRPGGTLVDIGCGQGLMLALLAEAASACRAGAAMPQLPAAPVFDRLIGVEKRPRVASIARKALGNDARIIEGDAQAHVPERCRVVLLFDVLHMMAAVDQEGLLRAVAEATEPGGIVLVREADAAAGWRFAAVRTGNRAKAVLFGNWRQRFHFRSAGEWTVLFERLGFRVESRPSHEGTPFGNVLFVLAIPPRASA